MGSSGRGASDAAYPVFGLIMVAGAVALIQILLQGLSGIVNKALGLRMKDYVQGIIQKKSMELDLAFFENPEYFDSLHRAQKQGGYRPLKIVSGMDPLAEVRIFEQILDHIENRVVLLISHRFSTLRFAHRIWGVETWADNRKWKP